MKCLVRGRASSARGLTEQVPTMNKLQESQTSKLNIDAIADSSQFL